MALAARHSPWIDVNSSPGSLADDEVGTDNAVGLKPQPTVRLSRNMLALVISFVSLGFFQFVTLALIGRLGGAEKAGIWAYAGLFLPVIGW